MAFAGYPVDIRLLLSQTQSNEAHPLRSNDRISYKDLPAITELDPTQLETPPILGIFIARCIHQ